jgi:hypothetical protein
VLDSKLLEALISATTITGLFSILVGLNCFVKNNRVWIFSFFILILGDIATDALTFYVLSDSQIILNSKIFAFCVNLVKIGLNGGIIIAAAWIYSKNSLLQQIFTKLNSNAPAERMVLDDEDAPTRSRIVPQNELDPF